MTDKNQEQVQGTEARQPQGQTVDINVLFRSIGEKAFLLEQATQGLSMAQQQIAAMNKRINELEAENRKLKEKK